MGKTRRRRRKSKTKEEGGKNDVGQEGKAEEGYRRYAARQYDDWMWKTVEENAYGFPEAAMLFAMASLKRKLWKRYGFFYDAETIREVYPENELAEWVREAFELKKQPKVPWRDSEMSYEWANDWCEKRAPTKIRSYEEEMEVQAKRRRYRESGVAIDAGAGIRLPARRRSTEELAKLAIDDQEERRIQEERAAFWRRRRNPIKAQHDAGEPDYRRWDALQRDGEACPETRKLSEGTARLR